MKRLLLLLTVVFISYSVMAQTAKEIKKELKIDNTDGKYTVTLVTTEDGKTSTITKTFNSLEELQNDPELGDVKIMHLDEAGDNTFFFSDDSLNKGEMKVIMKSVEGDELHEKMDSQHSFVFSTDSEPGSHKIKIWVDEDGQKKVLMDGKEIDVESLDGNSWTDENGKTYDLNMIEGNVLFNSKGKSGTFITDDGKSYDINVNVEGGDGNKEGVIILETTAHDDGNNVNVEVNVLHDMTIHLTDIEENEFHDFPGLDARELDLEELSYYPNPNAGKFTLAFKANKKPTEIKITSLDGKEVYTEKLQSFEGSYQKEIDLSGQQPGIYLLQVLQGKRALNKKIVIE